MSSLRSAAEEPSNPGEQTPAAPGEQTPAAPVEQGAAGASVGGDAVDPPVPPLLLEALMVDMGLEQKPRTTAALPEVPGGMGVALERPPSVPQVASPAAGGGGEPGVARPTPSDKPVR